MKLPMVVIVLIILAGLLLMNLLMLSRVSQADEDVQFYKMRFETLQGDVDILTYDLITSRDSVRILNNEIDSLKRTCL
jgi:hypothetical protein